MTRAGLVLMAACAISACAWGQAADAGGAKAVAFEVASVRPSAWGMVTMSPPGAAELVITHAPMMLLIEMAYGVTGDQISGPEWIEHTCFDVRARYAGHAQPDYKALQPALQGLLAERFYLTVHRGTKQVSGYALVVAKDSPKLRTTAGGDAQPFVMPDRLRMANMPVTTLATMLSLVLKVPVADQTGLDGKYDVDLKFAPADGSEPDLPSIFTAVQEELGIKLESAKVPVETVVIDHLERTPTEN